MKTKSDASTCTRDDIDLVLPESEQPINKQQFITKVDIERQESTALSYTIEEEKESNCPESDQSPKLSNNTEGIENRAFLVDEEETRTVTVSSETSECKSSPTELKNEHPLVDTSPSLTSYSGGSSDEDSDVSTTIIDGKRAISLSNFGKYAAQQQKQLGPRLMGPTFGYSMASAGFRSAGFQKWVPFFHTIPPLNVGLFLNTNLNMSEL